MSDGKKSKKKKIIIAIIVVLVLILILVNVLKPKEEVKPEFETAKIERKTLTTTISSTGKVTTENSKNVTSQLMNYKVTGVNVKVGDKVNVGDVLCTFDTADLAKKVSDLSATINASNTSSDVSLATAQRTVQDADRSKNSTLDDLKKQLNLDFLKQDYENHNAALNTAKANLNSNNSKIASFQNQITTLTAGVQSLTVEKQALETAYNQAESVYQAKEQSVANAQAALDAAQADPSQLQSVGNLQLALTGAIAERDNAKTERDNAKSALTIKENTLASQNKQIEEVTGEIQKLQTQINSIPAQEQVVNQKRDLYTTAQKKYDDTAASLNNQVANAQGQLQSAEAQTNVSTLTVQEQLTTLQKQLDETNLKSTVAGTVTAVNAKAGDYYTGGVLLTIEGVENFIVETEIDEYDIADIQVGMEANLKTDATRDEVLTGKVISVAPAASGSTNAASAASSMSAMSAMSASTGSAATYTVKISIDTQNERLRLGMNSKVSIITKKSENVLAVPYDAITKKDDETKVVTLIKDNDEEEEIKVNVGLESGYYTEISSDKLKEGMKVKLPKVESSSTVDELLNSMGASAGM